MPNLLQGTLDILILQTLLLGPAHGHTIASVIERRSDDLLQVQHGSLYPALHRLEDRGWVSSSWGTSENNRKARFYRLTAAGRRQLSAAHEPVGRARGRREPRAATRIGVTHMGWRRFLRRGWWDQERARELQAHIDIETDDNLARGMSPDQARQAAHRKLGNPVRIREEIYAMNTVGVLDTLWQDLRYGARLFGRNPGFTTVAVLTLALGIGGVTVIYSVIRNILLDPFPYTDSRRMVDVLIYDTSTGRFRGAMASSEFLDYQEQSDVFDGIIGTVSARAMMMPTREGAEALAVSQVTPNTFSFLGVQPLIGRGILESDGASTAPPIAVLSHKAWLGKFGADPGIAGRPITLDGNARTIVGVMPPRFTWHVADAGFRARSSAAIPNGSSGSRRA